jgi:iron complex transport system substrate-binding protein
VREAIVRVGGAVGRGAEAARFLAGFDAALERARAAGAGRGAPKVLFVFGRDAGAVANVDGAGPGTFLDELIRYAGGKNVLAGFDTPYPKVRLETIVRLAPEVIIDNVPEGKDPLAAWSGFTTIPAVRDRRVHAVRDRALLIPGPNLPRSVERLAAIIHGRP